MNAKACRRSECRGRSRWDGSGSADAATAAGCARPELAEQAKFSPGQRIITADCLSRPVTELKLGTGSKRPCPGWALCAAQLVVVSFLVGVLKAGAAPRRPGSSRYRGSGSQRAVWAPLCSLWQLLPATPSPTCSPVGRPLGVSLQAFAGGPMLYATGRPVASGAVSAGKTAVRPATDPIIQRGSAAHPSGQCRAGALNNDGPSLVAGSWKCLYRS